MIRKTNTAKPTSALRERLRCTPLASWGGSSHRWRDWARALRERFRCVAMRRHSAGMVYLHPRTLIERLTQIILMRRGPLGLRLAIRPTLRSYVSSESSADVGAARRELPGRAFNRGAGTRIALVRVDRTDRAAVGSLATGTSVTPYSRVLPAPAAVDHASKLRSYSSAADFTPLQTPSRRFRWPQLDSLDATDPSSQTVRVGRRRHSMIAAQVAYLTRQVRRRRQRPEAREYGRVERTLPKTKLMRQVHRPRQRAEALIGEPVERTLQKTARAAATPRTPEISPPPALGAPVVNRGDRKAFEERLPDLQTVTDHVMRQIDRRLTAWRERRGRM